MDWSAFYKSNTASNVTDMLKSPNKWKLILADRVRKLAEGGSVLEAGCGYGVTSLLVGEQTRRVMLDMEPSALEVSQVLFGHAGQHAQYVHGNLFNMPFDDGVFDVVFNAGVLEHFAYEERRNALREMARITRPGGCIIAAVPNHYSTPYAHAYAIEKARGTWKYPDEYLIFDFSREVEEIGGIYSVSRETCDVANSFSFLTDKKTWLWFRLINSFKHYEGYLTICTYRKAWDD
ncbi:methyltransferase domain-containing protein [bacterium]|nr:methyltransferase domain-containing protein [bacterium]